MKIEVKVPSVGESVSTADIESWERQTGDLVKKGEVLVILETDKASMEIPAEQDGRLETLKSKGEQVFVDEVIAFIETEASEAKSSEINSSKSLKDQRVEARREWEELKEEKTMLEIQHKKKQADTKYVLYKNKYPDNGGLKVNAEKLYEEIEKLCRQKDELDKEIQNSKERWNKLKEKKVSSSRIKSEPSSVKKGLKATDFKTRESSLEDFSPAVRHLIASTKLNPSLVEGTGRGGRLTKEDILNYLAENPEKSQEQNVSTKEGHPLQSDPLPPADFSKSSISSDLSKPNYLSASSPVTQTLKPDQRRESMTRLRRVTAERLGQSQHNTATLTTFNEVDLSRIIEIRKNYQEDFIKKYGFKLGFMSFFVKAVVVALKEFPKINAFVEGTDIIYNGSQHIGIAVSTEKGLVVPVLFHVERMSLAQIEEKIIEYRDKALARKLSPDDLLGGTFTISNGGVFGSLLSTPILNPPQSGILGMHKIEQRPVVRQGQIKICSMMYLALSYDHRMVDGRESVSFLVKVKEGLEEPSRLLIDI